MNRRLLALLAIPAATGCTPFITVDVAAPPAPTVPVVAFCGVHLDDPAAVAQTRTLAYTAGVDSTMGPCLPPDWSTYTPANPGSRYLTPDGYLELVRLNADAGMTTYVYDARLWSDDPLTRATAVETWRQYAPHIAGFDMGDEFDVGEWSELVRRWHVVADTVAELGVAPYTNHLPWMVDAALADLGTSEVSYDLYDTAASVSLAGRLNPLVDTLTCAVNALTHGPHVATPRQVRSDMRAHIDAGCDRILLFGGSSPYSTPGFDTPSLVTATGSPTALASAVRQGATK